MILVIVIDFIMAGLGNAGALQLWHWFGQNLGLTFLLLFLLW